MKITNTSLAESAILAFWFGGFTFVLLISRRNTPLQLSANNFQIISTYIPQGWSFFTKDPQEEAPFMWQEKDGKYLAVNFIGDRTNEAFGWSRKFRIKAREAGIMIDAISKLKWKKCRLESITCMKDYRDKSIEVSNIAVNPSLCGNFFVFFQKPVPWAWSESIQPVQMPKRLMKINVQCDAVRKEDSDA